MANGAKGEHEERTRVVCHLPLNSADEEKAFKEVVAYAENLREKKIGIDGYTYSDPKAFSGRWWSDADLWISDKVVLFIVDYMIALTEKSVSLSEMIQQLKDTIHQAYDKYGRTQEEVWVIAFGVTRHR